MELLSVTINEGVKKRMDIDREKYHQVKIRAIIKLSILEIWYIIQ